MANGTARGAGRAVGREDLQRCSPVVDLDVHATTHLSSRSGIVRLLASPSASNGNPADASLGVLQLQS
jgi:hypothetical protein